MSAVASSRIGVTAFSAARCTVSVHLALQNGERGRGPDIPDSFSRQLSARPLMSTTPVNNSPRPTGVLPTMRSPSTRTLALALASVAAVAALGGAASAQASAPLSDEPVTLSLVGFAVPKAGNDAAQAAVRRDRRRARASPGRPPTAPRATRAARSSAGLEADYVHFSLEPRRDPPGRRRPRRRGLERRPEPRASSPTRSWCSSSARATPRASQAGTTWSSPASASSPRTPARPARRAGTSSRLRPA